ncbi:hypothetical protein [Xylanibacter muris]|uniref:AAA+ ATPase domain-containing protein n=1 Tax=Xylanibacter muris TaxID=2736290 RepID=A0ABX2AKG6_9BACT|nr:hypothetical protein [Xylanibacter muris]NPD91681.1 hypothetical protein [Xylanibacter muris]
MGRALTVNEVLNRKRHTFPFSGAWADAFGQPERTGVWFVWGNSGNGKSSFVMQLCKELCKYDRVVYDSLEEGDSMTMHQSLLRHGMNDVGRRFNLLDAEPMEELQERLSRRKSWNIAVIDSFQYTQMSYRDYIRMKEHNKEKLLIFVSHAKGRAPRGSAAESVMYDATLKIWVEGFKAFSKGRFIGPTGEYTIWNEGVEKYWGIR